ncbi:MAG: BON domain-containing protein [Terriglobales bacterium]
MRLSAAALVLACLAPLGAQSGAAPATPMVPAQALPASGNTALTGAIMQRLTDDAVLRGITITANVGMAGAVSLNGVVPTQAMADRAVEVVKSVPGVDQVTSQILVNQDPFAPPHVAPANPPPISAAPPPPPAAREPQALLADALVQEPALADVYGTVYGNKVILNGLVPSDPDRVLAEQIARKIAPNFAITNIIYVAKHPLSPPPLVPHR